MDPDDWPLTKAEVALRVALVGSAMLFYGAIQLWVWQRTPERMVSVVADIACGIAALVLLRWRRRWPWQIAVASALLLVPSTVALGPAFAAYVSLCTHRRWRQIVPVVLLTELCLLAQYSWYGFGETTIITQTAGTVALAGATVLGLYLRSRRDLVRARAEQAQQAELAQQQMIEAAKTAERAEIAREMHDVLAHRISLVSMLAGGLAHRKNLDADEVRTTVAAIQQNAHLSLTELRMVLTDLRQDRSPAGAPEAPQPQLTDLDQLFDEGRQAGQHIKVTSTLGDVRQAPPQLGRHAFRILQEALTNARKHAPGSPVTVQLSGEPGGHLDIVVKNDDHRSSGSGSRLGLIGLDERVRLAGGKLQQGVRGDQFVLTATLPWKGDW